MSDSDITQLPFQEGSVLAFPFMISAEMMDLFGQISGDYHRLHRDDNYARGRGFQGAVVYGGLLVAQVSRLIGAELPVRHCVWQRLQIDFRGPLYVDEAARLEAVIVTIAESVGALSLKFSIAAGQRAIARGTADVVISHD